MKTLVRQFSILSVLVLVCVCVAGAGCVAVPKTEISGSLAGQPFKVKAPKDVDLVDLKVKADTNGAVEISIGKLTAKMNPEVISTTAAGQAAMISGIGAILTNVTAVAVSSAVSAAK